MRRFSRSLRDRNPSKLKKGAALVLNFLSGTLDPRITFTRSSAGTYWGSDGLLKTSAVNHLLHSYDLTQAAWYKANTSAVRNQPGLDGTPNSACLMTEAGVGDELILQPAESVVATHTVSFIVKRSTCDWVQVLLVKAGWSQNVTAFFNLATYQKGTIYNNSDLPDTEHRITQLQNGYCLLEVTGRTNGTSFYAAMTSAIADGNGTRAPDASYIIASGQLEVGSHATSHVKTGATKSANPRFDYDPATLQPRGLLIEGQSTNLLWQPDNIAVWPSHSSVVKVRNQIGLDGQPNKGTLITATQGELSFSGPPNEALLPNSTRCVRYAIVKAGTTSKIVLEKEDNSTWEGLTFDLSTDTFYGNAGLDGFIRNLGNGIKLCGFSWVTGATGQQRGANFYIDNWGPATQNCNLTVYHMQLEVGAEPTSPIIGGEYQATRAADNPRIEGIESASWYKQTSGTMVAKFEAATVGYCGLFAFNAGDGGGTNANMVYLSENSAAGFTDVNGTVSEGWIGNLAQFAKVAYTWDSGQRRAGCVDGGTVITLPTVGIPSATTLWIGADRYNGANKLNGHLRSLTYYRDVVSDSRLKALTAP